MKIEVNYVKNEQELQKFGDRLFTGKQIEEIRKC